MAAPPAARMVLRGAGRPTCGEWMLSTTGEAGSATLLLTLADGTSGDGDPAAAARLPTCKTSPP